MNSFQHIIDYQTESNKGINLFFEIENPFRFSQKFLDTITDIDINDHISINYLLEYVVKSVLKEFYKVNQYYNFNKQDIIDLKSLYNKLFRLIKQKSHSKEELAYIHYQNLKDWLQKTNPFAEKIYSPKQKITEETPCFEYSPALQLEILQIDLTQLIEPVLDIGCGENGNLVRYLREKQIDAYGIDRYNSDYNFIENTDWLEYNFEADTWGTIISNLGFSNHFLHHHLRTDGNFIGYAKKYMEILNSLKIGGKFHYAPSLPFIEQFLDRCKYNFIMGNIGENKRTIVERIA